MFKRILSYIMILSASLLLLISCSEEDDRIEKFTSNVDVSGSAYLADEKYHADLMFSTDDGATFVDYPVIKVGQIYKVKAVIREVGVVDEQGHPIVATEVTGNNCYDVDWSASAPAPTSTDFATGTADFVMGSTNEIKAFVTDAVTAYDPAAWAGTISALEDYGSAGTYGPYDLQLTQDGTNPNVFHLDNFYDSGIDAYIEFDGATNTVKFPDQDAGGKPITNSSGTFNQCRGTVVINLNYDGGDWVYRLAK